jgi:hypothetical protein
MVILTDDQQNPMSQPTKQNILRRLHWLVKDARPNDSLFLHYSGKEIVAGHTGGQNKSHIRVCRLTQSVLRMPRMLRLCSGSAQASSLLAQIKAAAASCPETKTKPAKEKLEYDYSSSHVDNGLILTTQLGFARRKMISSEVQLPEY